MSFQYKTVLILGATSGIGEALAEKVVENGSFAIVTGRRQENLNAFVKKHGESKAAAIKFDITDLAGIPAFIEKVTKEFPKLDSVILNSGIQRPLDFTKPESINLDTIETELTTNYTSYIHVLKPLLPFLQAQPMPTSLIFTTSGLAIVPITPCGNYCASKAALHHLIMVLREQLHDSNVKVIEILPPAVQTELHDGNVENGRNFGMPLKEFTDETWQGLCEGKENIPIGMVKDRMGFENERVSLFKGMVKMLAAHT